MMSNPVGMVQPAFATQHPAMVPVGGQFPAVQIQNIEMRVGNIEQEVVKLVEMFIKPLATRLMAVEQTLATYQQQPSTANIHAGETPQQQERRTRKKMNEDDARSVFALADIGTSIKDISEKLDLSQSTVRKYLQDWKRPEGEPVAQVVEEQPVQATFQQEPAQNVQPAPVQAIIQPIPEQSIEDAPSEDLQVDDSLLALGSEAEDLIAQAMAMASPVQEQPQQHAPEARIPFNQWTPQLAQQAAQYKANNMWGGPTMQDMFIACVFDDTTEAVGLAYQFDWADMHNRICFWRFASKAECAHLEAAGVKGQYGTEY